MSVTIFDASLKRISVSIREVEQAHRNAYTPSQPKNTRIPENAGFIDACIITFTRIVITILYSLLLATWNPRGFFSSAWFLMLILISISLSS